MSITKMIDKSIFLLKLYLKYTEKILKDTKDPEIKALIILNYRDIDLKKDIIEMYKIAKDIYERLKYEDYNSIYTYREDLEKKYLEFKTKIKERIKNLVKIRAYYLATKSKKR